MINENMFRGSENISSIHNTKQVLGSRGKGISRPKGNALGDVRNTLHSRPTANNSSGKLPLQKSSHLLSKTFQTENAFPVRKVSSEKSKSKLESKIASSNLFSPKFEPNDVHNHSMCEQAEEACFNNFLTEYKLSNQDVNNLVKHIKPIKINMPLPQSLPYSPCEDVKMIENKIWEDNISSLEAFDDLQIPELSPPEIIY